MARIRTVILRVAGLLVLLVVVGLSAAVWWIGSWSQTEEIDAARAAAALGEARAKFADARPALEIRGDRLVVVREPPVLPSPPEPAAAYLLMWSPDERVLSRIRLPLWISTFSTEPIPLEALVRVAHDDVTALLEAKRRGHELNLRIADLKRYGRALVLDGVTSDGERVLIWTE
jgi:hypothetical protein